MRLDIHSHVEQSSSLSQYTQTGPMAEAISHDDIVT